jgi:hypothetical protein
LIFNNAKLGFFGALETPVLNVILYANILEPLGKQICA